MSQASDSPTQGHTSADPPGVPEAAPAGSIDAIRPMVAEIRSRLASIAAREIALQRREQELTQQLGELESAARISAAHELRDSRSRVEKRSDELNAQAIELVARAGRLQRAEAALAARESALEARRQEVDARSAELDSRELSEESRRNEQEAAVAKRAEALREKERELERRLVRARDEIVRQRTELQDQAIIAERRVAELEARTASLAAQDAELQRRIASLETDVGALEKRRADQEAARRELERRQHQAQQLSQQLDQQRQILADRQRDLDQRAQQMRKQREKFLQQVDELKNQQAAITEQRNAADQQARRLSDREQQIEAQAQRVAEDGRALDERERQLTKRADDLVAQQRELAERDAELQRARDELFTLRESVELRDAEARQTTLAVELERQDLVAQRALLERAHEDMAQTRAELETRRSDEIAELAARREALERAQRSVVAAPRRWLLRSMALSLAVGLLVWPMVSLWAPVAYVASASLVVRASPDGPEQSAIRHAGVLADAGNLRALATAENLDSTLNAPADGVDLDRATVSRLGAEVLLELAGGNAGMLREFAERCAKRYIENTQNARRAVDPVRAAELSKGHEEFSRSAAELQKHIGDARALLALIPPSDRDAVLAETQALDAQRRELGDSLETARRELDDLLAGRRPEGVIDPSALTAALEFDVVYQEDRKELAEQIRRYRTELAVAMIAMIEPISNLRESAAELRALISEQRDLQPPAAVASVLEALAADVEAFEKFIAEGSSQWTQRRAALERDATARSVSADLEEALAQLVEHQQQAADLGRRVHSRVDELSQSLAQQIGRLTDESDGGTRAVVVAGLLRSHAATLLERGKTAGEAASAADPTTSFQLDACDRQLRGLRTRMQQRRDAMRQQLQLEADRHASESHAAAMERLRKQIAEAEAQREAAIQTLAMRLDELREMDEQEARRGALSKQIELLSAEAVRVGGELARIEQKSLDAEDPAGQRDVLEFSGVTLRRTGLSAISTGALAALLVFAACVLMVLRRPQRAIPIT